MRLLQMDFQPNFMAGHSLQDHDRSHWERRIQPSVVRAQQPKCVICGFVAQEKRSLIHADEVWLFPGPPKVVLVDVRPLCTRCHEAKDYAHLLNLIQSGARSEGREADILRHYCDTNKCTEDEFREDYKAALAAKRKVEALYNPNCRVDVDYGSWGRSKEKPRLTEEEQQLLRRMFDTLDEPIFIKGYKFSNYRSAVRTLQSIALNDRGGILNELRSVLDDSQDDEVIAERDEGIQWK